MTALLVRLQLALMALFGGLQRRAAAPRAAGFLEYSMMALFAIAIFGLLMTIFVPGIGDLFSDITTKIRRAGNL